MSIKKELTRGVFWIALAKYSGLFISLGVTSILARNVSPASFGTMAIATVLMAFLDIFTDLGIGVAIIQFKDLTNRQINSLFMVGVLVGLILAFGFYGLSFPLSRYYNDIQLVPVCHWLSLSLFFNALNIVPNGLMLKNKRFKVVSLRTLSFQIISGSIAVWGAVHGWGIYALLITPVVTSIGIFVVNYYNYPQKIMVDLDYEAVKKVWKYSSFQFIFNVINYFSRNIDKLIIGKYFSMSDLGYYDKSYRLMQLPLQNITFVITPVLHPVLSSLQDDKAQLAEKNIKLATILSQISFPLGIILYFCAGEIVEIIFGPNWIPAVPIFKIMAISVPLQIVLSSSGSVFLASGKSKHLFITGLMNTAITICGFCIAAIWFKTIESMAWSWDITLLIGFINSYVFINHVTFHSNSKKFFMSFLPQIVNSAIVIMLIYTVNSYCSISNIFIALIMNALLVTIFTVIIAHCLHQYNIRTLISSIIKKF